MRHVIILSCFLVLAGTVFAQEVLSAKETGKASVEGRVIKEPGGELVKKAIIELIGQDQQENGNYTATSDQEGHFQIHGIEPGRYQMFAERTGFIEVDQKRRRSRGLYLSFSAGQELQDQTLHMMAAAALTGRVLDEDARPMAHTLVEVWQANAAGRYLHTIDQHDAPLDPNFTGCGHTLTDADGHYRFITIKPGCYPWRNHHNAWRPAHIHFSLFGPAFATRLVTQMYFPGDPLLASDPIYNCTADEEARKRLISVFDWDTTVPETALGYRFDIVLRGREQTPMEGSE